MRLFGMGVGIGLWIILGAMCVLMGWVDAADERVVFNSVPGGTVLLVVYLLVLAVMVMLFLKRALTDEN